MSETISVPYPFVRETARVVDYDTGQPFEAWRPGCHHRDPSGPWEDDYYAAQGMGYMLLTVVDRHKPGRYPERTFYTRQWRDPDGKIFGRTNLRITTTSAFTRLTRGYRHDFRMETDS